MQSLHGTHLWIGNARDARDPQALYDAGIEAVVDLACEEPPAQLPREMIYLRIPIVDGGENDACRLRLAIRQTLELLDADMPTLVACSAGLSRSPSTAAIALALHVGEPAEESLARIASERSVSVSTSLWAQLVRIYEELKQNRE